MAARFFQWRRPRLFEVLLPLCTFVPLLSFIILYLKRRERKKND